MTIKTTPYGNTKTAEQEVQFSVDPSFGLTKGRVLWYSNGNRFNDTNFTENEGDISLTTTATGTDEARLHSAYSGQYVSHSQAQPGSSITVEPANYSIDGDGLVSLSHGILQAGVFWYDGTSIENGILLEIDASSAKARTVNGGSDTGNSPVSQENWNIDPCNGSGPSGFQLDPGEGMLGNFIYTWYSKGNIYLAFIDDNSDSLVLAHEFDIDVTPSIGTPNLPVHTRIANDGTATAMEVRQGGLQFTLNGTDDGQVEERNTPVSTTTSGSTISDTRALTDGKIDPFSQPGVPLLSVKREAEYRSLRVRESEVFAEPGGDIILFFWDEWDDSTALTGASFSEPIIDDDGKESRLLVDVSATDYTPTQSSFRGMTKIEGGNKNQVDPSTVLKEDKVPIDATRVVTAVNTGSGTDVDPLISNYSEGF